MYKYIDVASTRLGYKTIHFLFGVQVFFFFFIVMVYIYGFNCNTIIDFIFLLSLLVILRIGHAKARSYHSNPAHSKAYPPQKKKKLKLLKSQYRRIFFFFPFFFVMSVIWGT